MRNIYQVAFENDSLICECDVEKTPDGALIYDNILVTDKLKGTSYETLEIPEGLTAVAHAVANATLEEE